MPNDDKVLRKLKHDLVGMEVAAKLWEGHTKSFVSILDQIGVMIGPEAYLYPNGSISKTPLYWGLAEILSVKLKELDMLREKVSDYESACLVIKSYGQGLSANERSGIEHF